MDEERLIPAQGPVVRNLSARLQRFGARGEGGLRLPGIHLDDHFAGRGRAELEDLALGRLKDVFHGNTFFCFKLQASGPDGNAGLQLAAWSLNCGFSYFLSHEPPSRWQGQHFSSERTFNAPATPSRP